MEAIEAVTAAISIDWNVVITGIVGAVITGVVTVVGIYIKAYFEAKIKFIEQSSMSDLKKQIYEALYRSAMNISNKELKDLADAAPNGISKDELHELGIKAIENVKQEFTTQGVDIINKLGPGFMDSALRYIVDLINKNSEEPDTCITEDK